MLGPQNNGVVACSEAFPNCSDIGSEVMRVGFENREEVLLEGPVSGGLKNQRDLADGVLYFNGHGSDKDMERALEHQAQLIGQYEAEEKAQREWEEKFRGNNSSEQDSCKPGNHSNVTEERDEIKAPDPPYPAGHISSQNQEENSKMGNVCFTKESCKSHPYGFQPPLHVDMGCLQDKKMREVILVVFSFCNLHMSIWYPFRVKKCSSMLVSECGASELAFPIAKGKQIQEWSESLCHPPSHRSHHHLHSLGSLGIQSAHIISLSRSGSIFCNGEGRQNELALMPHDTSAKLGSVLDALQQAKLSLSHNLNRLPLIEGESAGKATESSVPSMRYGDRVEIPVGSAGLFKVPADFQFEATTQAKFLGSGPQLNLTNYYPDTGIAVTSGYSSITNLFMESKPITMPSRIYMESRSRFPIHKPFFEPHLDTVYPLQVGMAFLILVWIQAYSVLGGFPIPLIPSIQT